MKRIKVQSQPRIAGIKRMPRSSSFLEILDRAVEREANRFNVSKSFVIAVAVSDALNIDIDYDYKTLKVVHKKTA